MPSARVIDYYGAPRVVVPVFDLWRATFLGQLSVAIYHANHRHYGLKIYYYNGWYYGYHHDHYDYFYGDHNHWWCPHNRVYLDWGYPGFFVTHYHTTYRERVKEVFGQKLVQIGDTLYFKHESRDGLDSHYDRFEKDADLFYCSRHNTYFKLEVQGLPDADQFWVGEYDLYWSTNDQVYVSFLLERR